MGNRPLKRQPLTEKLVTAARIDDPDAAEIAVSYPDKWELMHHVRRLDNNPRYIAGLPPTQEAPRRDHPLPAAAP